MRFSSFALQAKIVSDITNFFNELSRCTGCSVNLYILKLIAPSRMI